MRDITGTLEEDGSADNPVILRWADEIASRFPEMRLYCAQYTHDSIPWCGLTVGYVMAHNGIRPIFGPSDTDKFLWARAWSKFGTEVEAPPQPGDVLVFPGHVSLFDGEDGDYYLCRGGNQSDSVNISRFRSDSVIAIRRPPIASVTTKPPSAPISTGKPHYTNIVATVFGGNDDPNVSAYDEHKITDDELGVALPYRFKGDRPRVRVFNGESSVDCTIVDVGPWNINDPYWETNSRPQAESGTDLSGRTTNRAGIDLTPAAAFKLGINGKGIVDWMFISAAKVNTDKEEKVVREASKKIRLMDTVRAWIKAAIAAATGIFTMDNFGMFNTWLGIGEGKIPVYTLLTLALGGVGVWWLINTLDKMSMEDFRAGRWMPSKLATDIANPVIDSDTPSNTDSPNAPKVPLTQPESSPGANTR